MNTASYCSALLWNRSKVMSVPVRLWGCPTKHWSAGPDQLSATGNNHWLHKNLLHSRHPRARAPWVCNSSSSWENLPILWCSFSDPDFSWWSLCLDAASFCVTLWWQGRWGSSGDWKVLVRRMIFRSWSAGMKQWRPANRIIMCLFLVWGSLRPELSSTDLRTVITSRIFELSLEKCV